MTDHDWKEVNKFFLCFVAPFHPLGNTEPLSFFGFKTPMSFILPNKVAKCYFGSIKERVWKANSFSIKKLMLVDQMAVSSLVETK